MAAPNNYQLMANAFRSDRLVYRAWEDDDEDFFFKLESDPATYAMSDASLLKPITKKDTKESLTYLQTKTLMAVLIAIPPTPEIPSTKSSSPTSSDTKSSETTTVKPPPETHAKKEEEPKPTPIGMIALNTPHNSQPHHRNAYISIEILGEYQGKGYGSEAITWILDWAFRIAGLHRVGIESFSFNTGATKLYEKMGFSFEGRQREVFWFNGGWGDLLTFGILDSEWEEFKRCKMEGKELPVRVKSSDARRGCRVECGNSCGIRLEDESSTL